MDGDGELIIDREKLECSYQRISKCTGAGSGFYGVLGRFWSLGWVAAGDG